MGTLVRFDWAIKRLLRNKANFAILEGFLSELLKEDIKIIELLESESNRSYAYDKQNRVDMLVRNSKEERIIVEIQQNRQDDYFHRMVYATSKLVTEQLIAGDDYDNIKRVISINILYFDLGQGTDYIYHGKTEFKGLHTGDTLQLSKKQEELYFKKEVCNIFPEYYVIKINNFNDVAKDSLDEWIYVLKNSEVKDHFTAKGLALANEELNIMKLSKAEMKEYERYIDNWRQTVSEFKTSWSDGWFDGRNEGRTEGKSEEKVEIALKAKKMGMSVQDIANLTGLSEVEINKL